MTTSVEAIGEEEEVNRSKNITAAWEAVRNAAETPIVRSDAETVNKTNWVATPTIASLDHPSNSDQPIDPSRISSNDPKLLQEVMNAVLGRADLYDQATHGHITHAENLNKEIATLNALNKFLLAAKGDDALDMANPKIKELLDELKIELPNGTTVSGARSHFESLITTKRYEMNSIFTKDIQPSLQNKQMLYEIMKDIQRKHDRFVDEILRRMQ